jgi:hypothetical protein
MQDSTESLLKTIKSELIRSISALRPDGPVDKTSRTSHSLANQTAGLRQNCHLRPQVLRTFLDFLAWGVTIGMPYDEKEEISLSGSRTHSTS